MTRSRLLLLTNAIILNGLIGPARSQAPDQPPKAPEKKVEKSQPRVTRLVEWDGRLLAYAEGFYELDLDENSASPFRLSGIDQINAVATYKKDQHLALCRVKHRRRLVLAKDGRVHDFPLPPAVVEFDKPVLLTANESSLLLLAGDSCWQYRGDHWLLTTIADIPATSMRPYERDGSEFNLPDLALLADRKLYLGYGHGEFGGSLLSLTLSNGQWEWVSDRWTPTTTTDEPVEAILRGPHNTTWVCQGLHHMGLRIGVLRREKDDHWTTAVAVNNAQPHMLDWPFGETPLVSAAFDGAECLCLLTEDQGIVRWDEKQWKRLTPNWPKDIYPTCFILASKTKALVGTRRAGVLNCNLKKGTLERIKLK